MESALDDDIAQIRDTLSRVAYLLDSHDYDRLGEVFAPEIEFNNPGRLTAHGLSDLIERLKGFPDKAISHYATNIIVTRIDASAAHCQSKALTLRSGGVIAAAEYTDTVGKGPDGWRITSRQVRPLG